MKARNLGALIGAGLALTTTSCRINIPDGIGESINLDFGPKIFSERDPQRNSYSKFFIFSQNKDRKIEFEEAINIAKIALTSLDYKIIEDYSGSIKENKILRVIRGKVTRGTLFRFSMGFDDKDYFSKIQIIESRDLNGEEGYEYIIHSDYKEFMSENKRDTEEEQKLIEIIKYEFDKR